MLKSTPAMRTRHNDVRLGFIDRLEYLAIDLPKPNLYGDVNRQGSKLVRNFRQPQVRILVCGFDELSGLLG